MPKKLVKTECKAEEAKQSRGKGKLQKQAREEAQVKAKATEEELREALQSAKERVRKAEHNANTFHGQL